MDDRLILSQAFLLHARAAPMGRWQASAALEEGLEHLWETGRATWPDIVLPAPTFIQHVAERIPERASADEPERLLDKIHSADLYLACACSHGIRDAIETFDRDLLGRLPVFLGQMNLAPAVVDEVRQLLRQKFLMATPGQAPRIAEYSGRGALANWVRVAAVRTALNLLRDRNELLVHPEGGAVVETLPSSANPELEYIKTRYEKEFKEALQAAFDTLSSEQRDLLSLHFVRGLSTRQIATLFQVTHPTVGRWLASAREVVMDETRRRLRERLGLTASEFDSVVRLLHSQLDVSITLLLKRTKE